MSNMDIWGKVCTPPATALKKITGGRLSGMTDINPQWRFQVLTEVFGPVGDGWKYEIDKLWMEPGTDGQIACFALVNLYWRKEGGWSAPIPGIGGNMFIAKERTGMHTSDEAYKMAVTDAISVAAKTIGIGADVYAGRMDGSKYQKPSDPPPPKPEVKPFANADDVITEAQKSTIIDMVADTGTDIDKFLAFCGCKSFETIPAKMYSKAMAELNKKKAKVAA